MRTVLLLLVLSTPAWADEPTHLAVGVRAGALHLLSTSGGEGGNKTEDQGVGVSAGVYADWRIEEHLRIGLSVPSVMNGPGPTSNEYDVGVGLRVVGQQPIASGLDVYLSLEPSVQWARLPESIWWTGHAMNVGAGVRRQLGASAAAFAQLSLAFTNFSGTVDDPATGMPTSGSVRNAFIGGAVGVELLAL